MKELLTKKDEYRHYTNDLTKEMDNYLSDNLKEIKEKYGPRTYIDGNPINNTWLIRYPGATRGCIVTDNNGIITEIQLYKDDYNTDKIYGPVVRQCFDKYIGMKMVIGE